MNDIIEEYSENPDKKIEGMLLIVSNKAYIIFHI